MTVLTFPNQKISADGKGTGKYVTAVIIGVFANQIDSTGREVTADISALSKSIIKNSS